MATRSLCDTNMTNYKMCEKIDPHNLSDSVFGYNHEAKVPLLSISALPLYNMLHPDAPTFEINDHEASLWYQYDELKIV